MTAKEFFAALGEAADDLGYLVEEVRVGSIRLRPRDKADLIVTIETDRGYLPVDAETLRDLLVPRPERKR